MCPPCDNYKYICTCDLHVPPPPPPPHAQELDESKQEVERVQTELRAVRESYGKAQNTIRAARSRIQNITAEKEQVSNLYAVY